MFGINFLRNLFTSYSEKQKPEVAMTNFGVFIRGSLSNVAIIDKCRQLLQSFQSDSKILHVIKDPVHSGLKVFFNSGSAVHELLKKKVLNEGNESSTIHSLTTALSVHEAFPNNEEEFKEAIRDQIRNLISIQVLDITKVPIDPKYPEIGTGKWIIVLDIPEIDELEEFKNMGLPNNMVLKFPTNDDHLRVKFYCCLCQKDGHVQSRCMGSDTSHSPYENIHEYNFCQGVFAQIKATQFPEPSNSSTSSADPPTPIKSLNTKKMASPSPRPSPSGFRIRDRSEEIAVSVKKPIGIPRDVEEFASEIGREEVRRSLSIHDGIKQEIGVNMPNIDNGGNSSRRRASNENFSSSCADEAERENSSARVASSTTTDKESLEIIFESNPIRLSDHIQSPPDNSHVVTTTNQNQQSSVKRELSSTDDEDSNPATTPAKKKKTMQLLDVVIPDRIRDIISGMPDGVLDVRQLEAFFNHVKKKSRPSDFAKMYTDNVEGLHSQLVAISRLYYMSPNVGSKADIQFMKMLGNVLKRFYNTAVQRRATARH